LVLAAKDSRTIGPDAEFETAARVVAQAATEAGRDPATIGLEPRLNWAGELNGFVSVAESWRTVGATHAAVDTMGAGLAGVDEHLKVLSEVARALTELSADHA
jgi:hypothetical protein